MSFHPGEESFVGLAIAVLVGALVVVNLRALPLAHSVRPREVSVL